MAATSTSTWLSTTLGFAVLCILVEDRRRRHRRTKFETVVDRSGTFSVKHGLSSTIHGPRAAGDAIQLWVADMELPCCEHIQKAIEVRSRHAIPAGYTYQPQEAWRAIAKWLVERQHWPHPPDPLAFIFSANVVASFCNLIRACTRESDGVVVMSPAYAPLQDAVKGTKRKLLLHPLTMQGTRYDLNLAALTSMLATERPTMLMLMNPHNPSGRVWSRVELEAIADACSVHNVLVVSDEIWGDWCLSAGSAGSQDAFVPFAAVAATRISACGARCRHVTLSAPTKTFNLAGLHCSFVIAEDERIREAYLGYVAPATLHYGSAFATVALVAAYSGEAAEWLDEVKDHVQANAAFVTTFLRTHALLELIRPWPLTATYLVWLDCTRLRMQLGLDGTGMLEGFFLDAGVVISPGTEFDPTGRSDGFMRINVACPRSMLVAAMERIRRAIASRP
jgi:cystathionine beta-lyase